MIKSTIILTMGNLLSSSVHGWTGQGKDPHDKPPILYFFFKGTYPRSISLFEVPWCLRPLFHLTKLSISNILCDKVHEVGYLHGNSMAIRVRTLFSKYNYKRNKKMWIKPQVLMLYNLLCQTPARVQLKYNIIKNTYCKLMILIK